MQREAYKAKSPDALVAHRGRTRHLTKGIQVVAQSYTIIPAPGWHHELPPADNETRPLTSHVIAWRVNHDGTHIAAVTLAGLVKITATNNAQFRYRQP